MEKLSPDIITLTDEKLETFIGETLITKYGQLVLEGLTAQKNSPVAANPVQTELNQYSNDGSNQGNSTRVSE